MATATIQIAYEAETTSLKGTVNEINKINDQVVEGAKESATKAKKEYVGIANAFTAAFSGGQAKKALDNQAKAIDNLGKSGKSLTGQLRGLKQELANLEIAGQEGSAAFNQLLIAAAKLEDQIGDTRDRVKILASDTFKFDAAVGATQALASGFELAQGAATLFGAENEDLQRAIAKVTAATAVANSVQQLSSLIKEESAVKTAALNIIERVNAASVRQSALSYNILGASVQFSARSLNIFKAALAATGIGAAIIGISILVDIYKDLQDASAKSSQAIKDIANANQELAIKTIEAQEQLDLALGKISERQVERNVATRKFASELLEIQLANNKRLVENEEATNKAIFLSRASNIAGLLAPAIQAKLAQDVKKLEQDRLQIVEEGNKQIEAARKNFNLERQKSEVEFNKQDKAKAKEAADKALEAQKKVLEQQKKLAEDQAKAREQLSALEDKALETQLSAKAKIRVDSEKEIAEIEKQFRLSNFKAGTEEAKQAEINKAAAIATIRTNAEKQIDDITKENNKKLLAERLEAAKAAEGATLQQQLEALENQEKIELAAAESVGAKEAEIKTRYASQIAAVKLSIADKALNDEINKLKTLEITEGSSLERREALIRAEGAKRVKAAGDDAEAIKLINAETDAAITEENKKETDKRIDLAFQYAEAVLGLFSQLNELSKQASEQRIADIQAASDKELEAINASADLENDKARQRAALAKRTAAEIAAEKTKTAKQDKALALFDIAVNTAKGIVSALGTTPPNPILAAFIGVTGALQLAAVASKPIPKFERGGVVGGRLHSGGGTMVEAERDEYIVNRRQSINHRRELDAINSSSDAFRKLIEQRYVRPALMNFAASNRNKQGVTVNASLNSKSMEKEIRGMRKDLKSRNVVININQTDSRYVWQ